VSLTAKFHSFYSRLPHPQNLRFRVWMIRMHGPQWNNTRIIIPDARYPAIDAFYLSGRVATKRRTWISCRLIWWKGSGKRTVTCTLLWMRCMIFRPGCRGQRWGRYWCMWGCDELKCADMGAVGCAGHTGDFVIAAMNRCFPYNYI